MKSTRSRQCALNTDRLLVERHTLSGHQRSAGLSEYAVLEGIGPLHETRAYSHSKNTIWRRITLLHTLGLVVQSVV